jgi:CHAT domain-containing protein
MRPGRRTAAVVLLAWSALACERTARDPPAAAPASSYDSLFGAGTDAYRNGDFEAAEGSLASALELSRSLADPAGEARALHWLGRVAWQSDQYPLARERGEQALQLQLRHSLTAQLFDSYNILGLIAYSDGRYFDSAEQFRTAFQLADAHRDTANLIKALQNTALPLTELGDYPEARRLLLAALPMARAIGNPGFEGRILTNLGMLAVRTGDPDAALGYLGLARDKFHLADDRPGEVNALSQAGTAYAAMGEPGKAIAAFDSALAEARSQEDRSEEAVNLGQLAAVYAEAGEYPRALLLLDSARALHEGLEMGDEAAADRYQAAEIYLTLGNLSLARESAQGALATHRGLGARLAAIQDHLLLARIAVEAADPQGAKSRLAEARREAAGLDARSVRLAIAIATARLADRTGDARGALRALDAVAADVAAGGMDREWEFLGLAARAWARAGELDSAAAVGRRAVAAVERIRGDFGSRMLRTSYLAERSAVYHDLVRVLLRLGRTGEAFATSDGARGLAMLEHLSTVRTHGAPSVRELAEAERQLLRQVDSAVTRIDQLRFRNAPGEVDAHAAELARLQTELARIRAEYSAAIVGAEERSGDGRSAGGGARSESGQIREALRPEEALLEYFIGEETLILFVVTRDSVKAYQQPVVRTHLTNRIRIVRELTGRAGSASGAHGALEALDEILLGPARQAGALAGRTGLIVVPHAELTYVPFAALRNRRTGRYLVEDHSLLDLPSAGLLPVLRRRAGGFREPGHAVALAPFPRELPGASTEVGAMQKALDRVRAYRGSEATEARFRAALGSADLVHLASHGVLNVRSPLFSRMELRRGRNGSEDDGRLEVHEVNRMRIGASLVFLSGCETGIGSAWSTGFTKGEDYATLSRAFLHAGAGNVIATLWRVEDLKSADFAEHFYDVLGRWDRAPPEGALADALASAQRRMIRTPGTESPFHWAGFRLTGSGDLSRPGPVRPAGTLPAQEF